MNVHIIDRMRTVPGYRGMVQPIEEAAGPLLLLRDLIEEEPLEKVLRLLDLGLALYAAGDTLFVIRGDLLIYAEMLESIIGKAALLEEAAAPLFPVQSDHRNTAADRFRQEHRPPLNLEDAE